MYDELRAFYKMNTLPSIDLGGIVVDGQLIADGAVHLVLHSLNRHGLIAGATGSGKTKTIQALCEQLSLQGVPSLVMDVKGDISGLAMPGVLSDALIARNHSLNLPFTPRGFPVELLALGESVQGVPVRALISELSNSLFARLLDLNDTQEGVLAVLFEYAQAQKIPLLTLDDFKNFLLFAQTNKGQTELERSYGNVSVVSLRTILRKTITLDAQIGADFFGEPAFNVMDLLNQTSAGLGVISIVQLMTMQDKSAVFSTFMLKLLSDVYRLMPEVGDVEKPKLILFIDEAHLLFRNANKVLLNLLDTVVKLIRSKGIGIIFCTQTANDIPENILSQLGLKIQHALRAFTAKDRTVMKLVAQNFPLSNYYNTEQALTALGIGEALVCGLDEKGVPTPLIQCRIRAPESRMGVLTHFEIQQCINSSKLYAHYSQKVQRVSAKDMLGSSDDSTKQNKSSSSKTEDSRSSSLLQMIRTISKNTLFRQVVRQVVRDSMRAIMTLFNKKR